MSNTSNTSITGRALHYVFKIGERGAIIRFCRDILGMRVLRHEEFAEGCDAACNGPYENRWSKTMVGYGPENNHFVLELTYNYPIKSYKKGNDFIGITIKSKEILERAKTNNWPILAGNVLEAPGGYNFYILDEPQPTSKDPVQKFTIATANLKKSLEYWNGVLGLKLYNKDVTNRNVLLGFNIKDAKLEIQEIDIPIDRAEAYGRIAYSCPHDQQPEIEERARKANTTILFPLTSLDTPGKETVRVIILADPNEHEICFVDDEAFRKLSKYEPGDEKILDRFIKKDESGELMKENQIRMQNALQSEKE